MEILSVHLDFQTVRARELTVLEKVHLPQPVMCHMSHVTCHMSRVTYKKKKIIIQCGGAFRWRVCYQPGLTALHRGLAKYLTAQDTRGTPTPTKHNRALVRLGNLLSLQPGSTIKVKRFFSVPSIE